MSDKNYLKEFNEKYENDELHMALDMCQINFYAFEDLPATTYRNACRAEVRCTPKSEWSKVSILTWSKLSNGMHTTDRDDIYPVIGDDLTEKEKQQKRDEIILSIRFMLSMMQRAYEQGKVNRSKEIRNLLEME